MLINCRIITNAKKTEIESQEDGSYKIRLNVIPEKGKANKKLVEILAERFDVARSAIRIVKGEKSRNKIIEIIQKEDEISSC